MKIVIKFDEENLVERDRIVNAIMDLQPIGSVEVPKEINLNLNEAIDLFALIAKRAS